MKKAMFSRLSTDMAKTIPSLQLIQLGGRHKSDTSGYAIVDPNLAEWLNSFTWHMDSSGYATRNVGRGETSYMHRLILGLKVGNDAVVDHINGLPFDNRRENLRITTDAINVRNKRRWPLASKNGRGVVFRPESGKWRARCTLNGRQIFFGTYETAELAKQAAVAGRASLGFENPQDWADM